MGLSLDTKKFEAKALQKADTNTCKVTEDLFTSAVHLSPSTTSIPPSPYSNDLFINQWYPGINGISGALTTATNPTGEMSLARIRSTLATKPFLGKDNKVTLVNNLGYASRVEHLGWPAGEGTNGWVWTGATPYGMVMKSIQKVKGIYS